MASNTGGAGELLKSLPCRGFFTSASNVPSSALGSLRVYICDHETTPSEDQVIKTDPTNILIRYLMSTKAKGESKLKDKGKHTSDNAKGKRPIENVVDEKIVTKKLNTGKGSSSKNDVGQGRLSEKDIKNCTVEKLRSLLKERGQTSKGKKDELIARLKRCL